jgi:vacuolar-type H+-ATPase subunit C/Vma6
MLLRVIESGGYPFEYLLARIAIRRGDLIADWKPILNAADPPAAIPAGIRRKLPEDRSAEGLWKGLLHEFAWVYGQLDDAARALFAPFFTWFELKTLILCLRNKAAKNSAKIKVLLTASLLAENLQKILAGERDTFAAVAAVETAFTSRSAAFRGLRDIFRSKGLQGLEQELTDTWLEQTSAAELHPALRDFIRGLIDFRNLLNLYKRLHWEVPGTPSFLKGGLIGKARLEEVLDARQPAGFAALLNRFPGVQGEVGVSGKPEHLLLGGMTRSLRNKSREPSGCGLLLDYLWRSYIETVNLGILCQWKNIERDTIAAELII